MRTAEIMSWTGHVLFAPRASITALLARPEVKRTGVYLLIGPNTKDADQLMVYVGEGDNVGVRISSHNKDVDKEFGEHVCVITSKDLNLTKAHARYLESRLIQIVKKEGRATLVNKSDPEFDLLPEADISDMDDFVVRLQVLLPVLGVDFIRLTPQVSQSSALQWKSSPSPDQRAEDPLDHSASEPEVSVHNSAEFRMSAGGLQARAVEVDGQMIIRAGSQARSDEAPSLGSNIRTYREQLRRAGKLAQSDASGILLFTEDVAFTSPSGAAQAVMGTSRNGRTDWINVKTNETYAA